MVEDRTVKRFLVLEVVIEQGLIDSGSARDGVGARPGYAFAGEFTDRSLQDGGPAFFGASAGTQARFGESWLSCGSRIN